MTHATLDQERVLIACIGNIFHGDDAFGCEVALRLAERPPRHGVRVVDYGIRAYDLAYAMLGAWELVMLVDATQRGGSPGTLYVIEPDIEALDRDPSPVAVQAHTMQPAQVLRLVKAFGGRFPKLLLIGCEPADLGDPEEGKMGLSDVVAAAVNEVPPLLESLVAEHFGDRLQNTSEPASSLRAPSSI